VRPVSRPGTLVLLVALAACAASWPAGAAAASSSCTRFAAPYGSDAASGAEADPFASVGRLVDSLGPGETGCLFGGTYAEDVKVTHGGTPAAPVTLRSRAGERATLRGRLWVAEGAADVVVEGLNLDGRNAGGLPSPTVNGDRVVFRGNDVTNYHTAICFVLGSATGWGVAETVVIERNWIHDCGRLPSTNHDHGIYVETARNAQIVDNLIYDNADRGVQLYPDAQGTLVAYNVIDGNGEGVIFSGDGRTASSGNSVTANVITNSTLRFNVESWWPDGSPVGTENRAERNCLWSGHEGNIGPEVGFTARDNVVANPRFADRAAKRFTLAPDSPCTGAGPRVDLGVQPSALLAPRKLRNPRIVGRTRRASVLRVRPGSWAGTGPLRFHYRWRRCDLHGAGCKPIRQARGHVAYRLRRRDVGHKIRAVVHVSNPVGARTGSSRYTYRVRT
jgi:Right handed beta helix region